MDAEDLIDEIVRLLEDNKYWWDASYDDIPPKRATLDLANEIAYLMEEQ